jgi:ribosomal-protein-alanine N-acetyltransferase
MRRLLAWLGVDRGSARRGAATSPPEAAGARSGPPARIEIRPARRRELAAILSIERASFQNPWSRAALADELEDPSCRFLVAALAGGPPLGYALLRLGPGEAELLSLAVAASERRRGLGRALLEAALERARAGRAEVCHLEARVTNGPALALYRRLGFAEVGRRRAYYADGTDAVLMSRKL